MAAPAYVWVLYFGGLGFLSFLWFYGDSNNPNPGPVDRMQRLFITRPLALLNSGASKLTGNRWSRFGEGLDDFFFRRPNRIFTLTYWLLFVGGYALFAWSSFFPPMIPSRYVGEWHMYFGSLYCFSCWGLYAKVLFSDPGVITQANHEECDSQWEYDAVLYEPKECQTCNHNRPARSKHCRVCNVCVARFDHHCIWINGCIGQGNHQIFMIFLIYHAVFMTYVSGVGTAILWGQVIELRLHEAWFFDAAGVQQPITYTMMFQWVLRNYSKLFAVTAFCALLQCLFYGFFCYQLGLLLRNVTTNETFKLKDLEHAAAAHNANLKMPSRSPYYVSKLQSLQEVCQAPISGKLTRRNPREVWGVAERSPEAGDEGDQPSSVRRRRKKKR